jgi:putative tryptophan/tyrosine transport system substrate-binding protein
MRRREFFVVLGGAAAVAWPLTLRAQQAMPVIGFLNPQTQEGYAERLRGFRQGLKEAGFVEGENVSVEYRWAENQIDRVPAMATDLVRRRVSVIVAAGGMSAVLAAKAATQTVPILFIVPDDPVKLGLVTSMARPTENLTGVNFLGAEVGAKRLELLRDLIPSMKRLAVLFNPINPVGEVQRREVLSAAQAMGLSAQVFNASTSQEIDAAFAALMHERPDALFVMPDPVFNSRRVHLVHLASRHGLPAVYWQREFAEAGGLMSYGSKIGDAFRQVGVYTGRLLKGAKPAELPVVQSERFELIINHQTARILGLAVPPSLLARADEVIE